MIFPVFSAPNELLSAPLVCFHLAWAQLISVAYLQQVFQILESMDGEGSTFLDSTFTSVKIILCVGALVSCSLS